MINERTLELTNMKDGKIVSTGKIEVAQDGKSRTLEPKGPVGQEVQRNHGVRQAVAARSLYRFEIA